MPDNCNYPALKVFSRAYGLTMSNGVKPTASGPGDPSSTLLAPLGLKLTI